MTALKRQAMTQTDFDALLKNVKVLRLTRLDQVKVAKKGKNIVKFFGLLEKDFYRRHVYSVATQFVRHAERFQALGLRVIKPIEWYRCKAAMQDVVVYPALPGNSVYELAYGEKGLAILKPFMEYVAHLHHLKVYFRAGHADNYLVTPDGEFALIDMDNARFHINMRRRAKNLSYILDHARRNHKDLYVRYGEKKLIQDYFDAAKLNTNDQKRFWKILSQYLEKLGYPKIT
jgi:hypothetical protein